MSIDKTVDIVSQYVLNYPDLISLYINPKEWQSAGRNLAIKNAHKSNFIAYIDGHCIADKKWLQMLYSSYQELDSPLVGGVGSIHKSPKDESLIGMAIEQIFCSFIGGFGSSYKPLRKKTEVNTAPYALYKKEALEKVGLYDENMRYGEDFTLNFKLRNAGYKIFIEPNSIVFYYKRSSFHSFLKQMYNYGVTKAIIWKKYPSSITLLHYLPSLFILFIVILGTLCLYSMNLLLFAYLIIFYLFILYSISFVYVILKKQWTFIVFMPILYIIEHFAYGFGFLMGLPKKGW